MSSSTPSGASSEPTPGRSVSDAVNRAGGAATTTQGARTTKDAKPAAGATGAIRTSGKFRRGPQQTFAGRVWVGLVAAAVLLVLVIIFIAENTKSIAINFLGAHGHLSEALALLLAIVVGIAITLLVGSARIIQLSVQVRRERKKVREGLRQG